MTDSSHWSAGPEAWVPAALQGPLVYAPKRATVPDGVSAPSPHGRQNRGFGQATGPLHGASTENLIPQTMQANRPPPQQALVEVAVGGNRRLSSGSRQPSPPDVQAVPRVDGGIVSVDSSAAAHEMTSLARLARSAVPCAPQGVAVAACATMQPAGRACLCVAPVQEGHGAPTGHLPLPTKLQADSPLTIAALRDARPPRQTRRGCRAALRDG